MTERITLKEVKQGLLKNPDIAAEYNKLIPRYQFIEAMLKTRQKKNISQSELAELMGTSQAAISRMESGKQLPSMETIMKFAKATNTSPVLDFIEKPLN